MNGLEKKWTEEFGKPDKSADKTTATALSYLDHAGATQPSRRFLQDFFDDLLLHPLGNPHSDFNSEILIQRTRSDILSFVTADPDEYSVIFTSGATASIKLVGEVFPWTLDSHFVYPMNSHTSLLNLRSFSPNISVVPSQWHTSTPKEDKVHTDVDKDENVQNTYHLVAVVGECNFSGKKAVLSSVASEVSKLRESSALGASIPGIIFLKRNEHNITRMESSRKNRETWMWLLDASKLVATSRLNLAAIKKEDRPHFIVFSIYKIFGFPSGLGVLIVKKEAVPLLRKQYFGGGTVSALAADTLFQVPRPLKDLEHLFEDGTPHFQGIQAIRHGLAMINRLGGMDSISNWLITLASRLAAEIAVMTHDNGQVLCSIFGNYSLTTGGGVTDIEKTLALQGPVVTFVVWTPQGFPVSSEYVGKTAASHGIHLRTAQENEISR